MDGFIMENHIKMDDLGVPLFSETSISNLALCEFHWTRAVNVTFPAFP